MQELIKQGMVELRKISGTINCAGLLTKYVTSEILERLRGQLGLVSSTNQSLIGSITFQNVNDYVFVSTNDSSISHLTTNDSSTTCLTTSTNNASMTNNYRVLFNNASIDNYINNASVNRDLCVTTNNASFNNYVFIDSSNDSGMCNYVMVYVLKCVSIIATILTRVCNIVRQAIISTTSAIQQMHWLIFLCIALLLLSTTCFASSNHTNCYDRPHSLVLRSTLTSTTMKTAVIDVTCEDKKDSEKRKTTTTATSDVHMMVDAAAATSNTKASETVEGKINLLEKNQHDETMTDI